MSTEPQSATIARAMVLSATIVLVMDQATKALAVAALPAGGVSYGPVRLTVVRNSGGPFGVAPGTSVWWTAVSLVALAALVLVAGRLVRAVRSAALLGVVVAGGMANVIDRLVRSPGSGNGAVVDWIQLSGYPRVFNLADVAIRVGALLLAVSMLTRPKPNDRRRELASEESAGMPADAGRVEAS